MEEMSTEEISMVLPPVPVHRGRRMLEQVGAGELLPGEAAKVDLTAVWKGRAAACWERGDRLRLWTGEAGAGYRAVKQRSNSQLPRMPVSALHHHTTARSR